MKKTKQLKKALILAVIVITVFSYTTVAFAAEGGAGIDPMVAISNLTKFILNIVSAVGVLALIWGGVQLGLALKSQDSSQKTQAMLFLAGGAIMVGIRFVLQAIGITV